MKYRMLIPCGPGPAGDSDVNLKRYRWCRNHLYEFVGYEKYTPDDGPPLWSWVMEKVLTEREEIIAAQAFDTGKWIAGRQNPEPPKSDKITLVEPPLVNKIILSVTVLMLLGGFTALVLRAAIMSLDWNR